MSLWKRACLYSIRKTGRPITLLVFLSVMATLMLTCLSIRSATETADANIKKALLGYFTVNAKQTGAGITEDVLKQILAIDGMSGQYRLRSYSYGVCYDGDGNLLEVNTEGAARAPEGYENAGKIVADSDTLENSYFTEAGFELAAGRAITSGAGNEVMVHETFACRNGLSVGDTMRLGSVTDERDTVLVVIAGIFTNTEEQEAVGMVPSCDLYDNLVFTDLSTASYLLYGTEGKTSVQYGDFYVNDPEGLERIMAQVQEMEGMDGCRLTRYDNDYQNAKESLAGLRNIVFAAIAVVSVVSFLVLALFLALRMRGRIHETGVYLAMGIPKGAVLMQYLLEVFLVAVAALFLSYGASRAVSSRIGSSLLSQVTAKNYEIMDLSGDGTEAGEPAEDLGLSEIVVAVSVEDYLAVWAFGIVLCLASTILAAYPIMKMNPGNILSQMS